MDVLFHRLAIREYRDAIRWFAARSLITAVRFQAEVDAAVARIAAAPDLGVPFGANDRWFRVRRFSYLLYYRRVRPDRVMIMAVAHPSRRPGYWSRRRP